MHMTLRAQSLPKDSVSKYQYHEDKFQPEFWKERSMQSLAPLQKTQYILS